MKLWAKKSLGQHFLNSTHVLEQIISAATIRKGEVVLEIGPGTGVLTAALLKSGANVIAVEKDSRAYELLKEKFADDIGVGRLKLIRGDILDKNIFGGENSGALSPSSLPTSAGTPSWTPASYSIVANIPYYITGAILEKFLENEPRPNRMILLVQKEVAERIVARPADGKEPNRTRNIRGKESILSISVKAFGAPKIIAKVPRGAFTPPPTVDSAILAIENISGSNFNGKDGQTNENSGEIKKFFEIVHSGFAHKRKFLIRNLETVVSKEKLLEIWRKVGLDEKVRAEDIGTKGWLRIAEQM